MKKYIFIIVSFLLISAGSAIAQRGFGTAVADSQAVLDLSHSAKGVLIPRLALSATNSISPFSDSPTASMLVYNNATAGDVTPGYYYWDGTQWVRLLTSTPIPPVIANLINEPYITYSASANLQNEKVFQGGTATNFTSGASNVQVDVRYDNSSVGVNGSNNLEVKDGGVTLSKISSSGATNGQAITYNGTNIAWATPTATPNTGGNYTWTGTNSFDGATLFNASVTFAASATSQTVANNDLVLVDGTKIIIRVNTAGANANFCSLETTNGTDGKFILILNEDDGNLTFSAGSGIPPGTGFQIPGRRAGMFIFNTATGYWYPIQ